MWPYSGKKTVFTNIAPSFGAPTVSPTLTTTGRCNLDKEYYQRLVSPQPGQLNFSANQIADDGRVYRCYGLNKREITEQYSHGSANKFQVTIMKPSKQLHQKNVSRLKVVLSLPAKERKTSLSHVTGAIMRNEIVPTETRLQNDAFLSDYVRAAAPKLPPLRRKSLRLAQDMETKLRTNEWRRKSQTKLFSLQTEDSLVSDSGTDTILPAITVNTTKNNSKSPEPLSDTDEQMSSYRMRGALPIRRKSSIGHMYRMKRRESSIHDVPTQSMDRKDSVIRTSNAISEQFRAVMQKQMPKERSDEQNMEAMFNLNVAGKSSRDTLSKGLTNGNNSTTMGYKARLEYGKNLERNWFKNYMRKQTKSKSPDKLESNAAAERGLRLDIFYSPEPESDSELDGSEGNADMGDDTSIQCGGFSTATAEARSKHRRTSDKLRRTSNLSHEAIIEEGGTDSNMDSSESDIEIVLKENQLIQRKTKHKMRKKRQRQMKRYRTFMPEENSTVPELPEPESEVPLTDQEIRALRLNLRNKERLKKLRGKRKFLQVANAVYIVAQFKKILQTIRKRKRNIIKKRQQRIAALVAKRLALKEARMEEMEEEEREREREEREPTPKPTLKSQFMDEIGYKLVYEMDRLKIRSEPASETEDDDQDSVADDNKIQTIKTNQLRSNSKANVSVEKAKSSKFANEVKKVSVEDAKLAYEIIKRPSRYHRRRNSIPRLERPLEFIVEVPVKPKRKVNKNKGKESATFRYNRRMPSPEPKHCTCFIHKRGALASSSLTSMNKSSKCQHQEGKKQKMKKVKVETGGLYRTYSLDNLKKRRPIELRDLLADIDIPAKEIKLQILARKFRRQRRRRQRIRLSPCRLSRTPVEQERRESDSGSDDAGSDDSDKSDYDFVYGAPFVGCGVMWNQNSRANREPTWTAEDVDREMRRLTRVFHELKECRYLRLDSFNTAIMAKLNEAKKRLSVSNYK